MTTTTQHPQYLIVRSTGAEVADGIDLVNAYLSDHTYQGAYLIHLDGSDPMPVGVEDAVDGAHEIVGGYGDDEDTIEVIEL